jgi:hypothetical protein
MYKFKDFSSAPIDSSLRLFTKISMNQKYSILDINDIFNMRNIRGI